MLFSFKRAALAAALCVSGTLSAQTANFPLSMSVPISGTNTSGSPIFASGATASTTWIQGKVYYPGQVVVANGYFCTDLKVANTDSPITNSNATWLCATGGTPTTIGTWPSWLTPSINGGVLSAIASAIPNSALANACITINGTCVPLGGSTTINSNGTLSLTTTGTGPASLNGNTLNIPVNALTLQRNGTALGSQTKLNLVPGTGIGIADDGSGNVTFTSTATGGTTNYTALNNTPSLAPSYIAFGDSITCGFDATGATTTFPFSIHDASCHPANGYPFQIQLQTGIALNDLAIPGDQACDVWTRQLQSSASGTNPSLYSPATYSLVIGTNDANLKGTGAYETDFKLCHVGVLSWLGIPAEYKALPSSATNISGWANGSNTTGVVPLASGTAGGSFTWSLTTYGGPIYVWHAMIDSNPGIFTVQVDSGSQFSYNTSSPTAMNTQNGTTVSMAGERIAGISAGNHVVKVTLVSGSAAVYGVGTPPANTYYQHPVVAVGDIPLPQIASGQSYYDQGSAFWTSRLQYNADILADVTSLQGDGLDIRYAPSDNYLLGTPAEYTDGLHLTTLGAQHLGSSISAVLQFAPVPGIAASNNTTTNTNTTGTYSVTNTTGNSVVTASTTSTSGAAAADNLAATGEDGFGLTLWNQYSNLAQAGVVGFMDDTQTNASNPTRPAGIWIYTPAGDLCFLVPMFSSATSAGFNNCAGAPFRMNHDGTSSGFTPSYGTPTISSALTGTGFDGTWSTDDHAFTIYVSSSSAISGGTTLATISFGKVWYNAAGTHVVPVCNLSPIAAAYAYPAYMSGATFGPPETITITLAPGTTIPANTGLDYMVSCTATTEH